MCAEEMFKAEMLNQRGEKRIIYISGSITNNPDYKKQFTQKYRELETEFIVLTPLFINATLEWRDYMHIDYAMIDVSDVIYMMKGWTQSKGARLERLHAMDKGIDIIYEDKEERE